MTQAKPSMGVSAKVEVAVKRKGEDAFTKVEEKQLAPWQAKLLALKEGLFDDSGNLR